MFDWERWREEVKARPFQLKVQSSILYITKINLFLVSPLPLSTSNIGTNGTPRIGRQHWRDADLEAILDLVEERPPLCSRDWDTLGAKYNSNYAVPNGRALRRGRAIQEKFDSLCKGPPTGAGGLSDRQRRARELAALIFNEQGAKVVLDPPADECDPDESFSEAEKDVIMDRTEGISTERSKQAGDFSRKRLLTNFSSDEAPPSRRRKTGDQGGSTTNFMEMWMALEMKKEERREEAERKKEEWREERERKREEQELRKEKEREERERRREEEMILRKQEIMLEMEKVQLEREKIRLELAKMHKVE